MKVIDDRFIIRHYAYSTQTTANHFNREIVYTMVTFKSKFLLQRLIRSTSLLTWKRQQQNIISVRVSLSHRNLAVSACRLSDDSKSTPETQQFDEKMLQYLACPLSKKPLRYDKDANELVCDEMGVAYPIINGIPNLIPQDARKIKDDTKPNKT
ncbi:protein preY, mitochondrial-like [Gigantopelta aegis]|uniref:protein preY, mitochondrial-like n=1 Tax=Gigantopelta aegis TaxID=1735272 RepID=UPI001B88973F|nr:protein preY, mitochondrial-like [Gigantopelta aegis]